MATQAPTSSCWEQAAQVFYAGADDNNPIDERAVIMDFNPSEGDTIQLQGPTYVENNFVMGYRVETVGTTTFIKTGLPLAPSSSDEIVAEIRNFTGFDLNATCYLCSAVVRIGIRLLLLRGAWSNCGGLVAARRQPILCAIDASAFAAINVHGIGE